MGRICRGRNYWKGEYGRENGKIWEGRGNKFRRIGICRGIGGGKRKIL